MVALQKLAAHLLAPYETAWAWGAKLAAANALSAFEVSALLGLSATTKNPLVPAGVPGAARLLGWKLAMPFHHIESAFFGGTLKFLQPLVCEQLRLCPVCVRFGYHFVVHQLRPFSCCPLHEVPLRERCLRCGERLVYDLGRSTVHGPITCPACRAPQLPVSPGGYPRTSVISTQTVTLIERWLTFLRHRCTDSELFTTVGMIDLDKFRRTLGRERIPVIRPLQRSRLANASSRHRCHCSQPYAGSQTPEICSKRGKSHNTLTQGQTSFCPYLCNSGCIDLADDAGSAHTIVVIG